MISKPKEYIDLLLTDMVKNVQQATIEYVRNTYQGNVPIYKCKEDLDKRLEIIDKTKQEIKYIISMVEQEKGNETNKK